MYNPATDLQQILTRLREDPQIRTLLNLTSDDTVGAYERVIGTKVYWDYTDMTPRIAAYYRPSRTLDNQMVIQQNFEVVANVPNTNVFLAYELLTRAKELLCDPEFTIRNQRIHFAGDIGELPAAVGFFAAASRLFYYRSI